LVLAADGVDGASGRGPDGGSGGSGRFRGMTGGDDGGGCRVERCVEAI
jgi:hypothetical protein